MDCAAAAECDSAVPCSSGWPCARESAIKTGADLNGKTFGVSALNDYFSLAARAWIDARGGDSSTIKLVEVPLSQSSGAVESGHIDAAILIQPYFADGVHGR